MAENEKRALGMLYGEDKSFTDGKTGEVIEYVEFMIYDDDGDEIRFTVKSADRTTFKKFDRKVKSGKVVIQDPGSQLGF